MTGEILYSFSIFEPIPMFIFFGTFLIFGGLVVFLVLYDESLVSASIFGILLIAGAMLCFKESANNKVDYIITKIETFTDLEKAFKENQSVEMVDNNVFLIKLKKKNQ